MPNTKIEWTDLTWNPVVGCTKVSAGCVNCYAEKMAGRLANMGSCYDKYSHVVEMNTSKGFLFKPKWNDFVYCDHAELKRRFNNRKQKKIFICSMSDLFHEGVPFSFIRSVLQVVEYNHKHIFQILTKRPERMLKLFNLLSEENYLSDCQTAGRKVERIELKILSNLWLGTTVENQDTMHRIETLKQIPATVRFVSFEPLLSDIPDLNLKGIDWVIVGGETGAGARPMDDRWVYSILNECCCLDIPFFFKGWGTHFVKKSNINYKYLSGREWNEFPEVE